MASQGVRQDLATFTTTLGPVGKTDKEADEDCTL